MSTEENTQNFNVNIKLPEFWHNDPIVWFTQVEALFATKNISSEKTKYNILLSSISPELATEVRDILLNTPTNNPYTKLKETILKRTTISKQKQIQQLLNCEELGDKTPTQLLRRLNQLLGEQANAIDNSILKEIFLQRLPVNVKIVLASIKEDSLENLAEVADKIMEISPTMPPFQSGNLNAIKSNCFCQEQIGKLAKEISDLRNEITFFKSRRSSRSTSPSPNSRRYCYYHKRYGTLARKCISPCYWSQGNPSSSN